MRRPKIMLIDDSELVLDVVGATLRDAGYDVVLRSVPIGAGAHIIRERPDLVLLDVSMPLMSGGEISQSVRRSTLDRGTCVVLHSDRPGAELAELVQRCGADGYIQKGSDPARLVSEVQGWIERARGGSARRATLAADAYGFVACAAETRRRLERELSAPVPLRYSESGTEALRHVCSSQPPAVLVVSASTTDVSCAALFRAACRSDARWRARFVVIEEPRSLSLAGAGLDDVPRWSSGQPVAALSTILDRILAS